MYFYVFINAVYLIYHVREVKICRIGRFCMHSYFKIRPLPVDIGIIPSE